MGQVSFAIVLENRLINFTSRIINLSTSNAGFKRANLYIFDQIVRSSLSAALNFGEARGAQSKKDFIHKNRLVLKELRETSIGLKVFLNTNTGVDIEKILKENDELISILVRTIQTAEINNKKK